MELEIIHDLVDQFGYIGLFLSLWLGVFGAPVPNEIIVMTVGLVSSSEVLVVWKAWIAVYTGIVCALTSCYLLGRLLGNPLLNWLKGKKRLNHSVQNAIRFMNKYHTYSLPFSYFFPGLRNFVPFLYGMSRLRFKTFALLAYSASGIWVTIFFSLGFWFGEEMDTITLLLNEILFIGMALLVLAFVLLLWKKRIRALRSKNKNSER